MSLRVLIVEDEVLVADYMARILEDEQHEVVGIAATAEAALELLRDTEADLAILDIKLKGSRDGIELAAEIARTAPGTAYMFVTGSGEPETRARAEAVRPVAFLQKPFDRARLAATLSLVRQSRS